MKPRVLHVLEAVEGGTARHVADLVAAVRSVEHSVVLPSARSVGVTDTLSVAAMRDAGATLVHLDIRRNPAATANIRALPAIRRLIGGHRASVVHGHSAIGGALARLATPRGVPVIYTPNAIRPERAAQAAERVLGRRTAVLVAVSESEAAAARALGLAPTGRVEVIPSGVGALPEPPIDLRKTLGLAEASPVVGMVARLVPQKAPDDFVRAMAQVARGRTGTHFVLVGEGPMRSTVERSVELAPELRNRMHLLGHIHAAAGLFPQLDVAVLTSRFEGLPYVVLEAMSAGVAVVATDVVGTRDALTSEENGLLVQPGVPGEIGAAVLRLLTDEPLRIRLGAAAQATVAARFSLERMAAAYDELYARLARPSRDEG